MLNHQTRIVVIGAGYAGLLATVRLAGKTRRKPVAITLVNATATFIERLRLHELAANQPITDRSILQSLDGTGVNFLQGRVIGLEPVGREIEVQTAHGTQRLGYDYLLYALGSTIDCATVPGVSAHAYTLTPSGPLSAVALRNQLPMLDKTKGRVVVCGGGATGIEAAAEFAQAYPGLQIRLITRGELGMFLGKSVATHLQRSLKQMNVTIQDHTTISEVRVGEVLTATGATIPFDLCLWTGGFTVPALAREAGLAVNERGQILIDPFMRSLSHPEIYAVGDAAHPVEEPGAPVRMSAYTAVIMGAHGADCLSAVIHGKPPQPFSFAYAGQGIALGPRNAIGFNNYPLDHPNRPYFTGRLGYEIRRLFMRLFNGLPGLERRWPGFFTWVGKGRYAAAKRHAAQRRPIEPPIEQAVNMK